MLSRHIRDARIRRADPPVEGRRVMPEACRDCTDRLAGLCPTWPLGRW